LSFDQIFSIRKLQSLGYIVWHCLRDRTFSRFNRTLTCDTDRQTDRQTNKQIQHDYVMYGASMVSRGN